MRDRAAGVDCTGSIVPLLDGGLVKFRYNVCGGVVGTINAGVLEAMEQALVDNFVIHKFGEVEAPRVLTPIFGGTPAGRVRTLPRPLQPVRGGRCKETLRPAVPTVGGDGLTMTYYSEY